MNKIRDKKFIKDFGNNLRKLRLARGMSQEQLGDEARLGKNQVGLIERGEVNVTISTIKSLAKALEVLPKDLFDY